MGVAHRQQSNLDPTVTARSSGGSSEIAVTVSAATEVQVKKAGGVKRREKKPKKHKREKAEEARNAHEHFSTTVKTEEPPPMSWGTAVVKVEPAENSGRAFPVHSQPANQRQPVGRVTTAPNHVSNPPSLATVSTSDTLKAPSKHRPGSLKIER